MKTMQLSIVVPVYNNYDLMDKLLFSLNNQSIFNFEVIFVDDSVNTINYHKLIDKLKKCKFNYQVYKNEKNIGPGLSRNKGIDLAKSNYITFVDADDYIDNVFVERIWNVIKKKHPDMIFFDYYISNNMKIKKALLGDMPNMMKSDYLALSNGMCWGKVFKKDIIIKNNIRFLNIKRAEDLAFSKVAIDKSNTFEYIPEPLYYYYLNCGSIMHSKNTVVLSDIEKAIEYINQNIEDSEAFELIYIKDYVYVMIKSMIILNDNTKSIKKTVDKLLMQRPNWYKNKYLHYQPRYLKIIFWLIKNRKIFLIKIIFKLKKG